MSEIDLRRSLSEAEDINGQRLIVGDKVRITQARLDRFRSISQVGEELRITEIYEMPTVYGKDKLGALSYVDGSGSIWNSLLNLYERVNHSNP